MKKFRITSFIPAFRGILLTFAEPNFRVHLAVAFLIITGGVLLPVSKTEWCLLILSIGFVISAEIFNTAIEYMMNFIHPDYEIRVGKIKDISAAAVLIASVTAVIVGIFIFLPGLIELLK